MPKDKQNVYRAMLHGLMELSDEFLIPQVPTTDGNWLYDVFFQLRLDHPEIFWAVGFKYRYYKDSPNLILIPEYIFDKNKIREHQKALGARVDKLVRTAMKFSEWDKEKYLHDFTGDISASPVEGEFAAFFCGLEGTFVYVFQFGEG